MLDQPVQRIIALAPFITELVYAAGAGSKLVGASEYSDYPEAANSIPRVGNAAHIDIERILLLKPDLILGWRSGSHAGELARLEKLGFKVFVMEPVKLADIPRLLRTLGKFAGTRAAAEIAAKDFEDQLESLRERFSGKRPVTVFYEIWHQPLMTINGEHIISDVLKLCGGVNVYANVRPLTPIISIEGLLAEDPEAIISGVSQGELWQPFKMLSAVRRERIFFIPPEWLERQSPRILEGAREICERLDTVRKEKR
ncbi:MAG TPA: cobalamin-binding protein [Burkholderiales bacterium]|nr:cobalamin-binding protein [Burkholderiales bacterium]